MKRLFVVLLAVVGIVAYYWLNGSNSTGGGFSMPPPVISTDLVQREPVTETIEALGTTRAWEAVDITAKTSGKVNQVHFSDNTSVSKGDVIVELVADSEMAALREAEVNLREGERLLRHYQALDKTNAVSKTLIDEQAAKVAASRARVAAAHAELDDFVIQAPFSGLLGVREVSPGALVEPGDRITTLDDVHMLKLDFTVPERWLGHIQVGQSLATRSVAFPDKTFSAEITSLGTRVDAATRAMTIVARLPNPGSLLRPGMLLSITLTSAEREALLITEQALLQEGSEKFVFRVDGDNQVHRVAVETGLRTRGKVEILSGLNPGDQVVAEGTQKVRDGITVVLATTDLPQ